ncbi:hypothetical protein T8833_13720 [Staphylococcus aureus]|nr:hypothetical protein T8833_13720 [Staphylococcus aureus]
MQVGGAQHREIRKEILQVMQVGKDRNKFCENIISVPIRDVKILRKNNATNYV